MIIPTRNRPAQLAVALRSVLDQQYRNFEVIILNDGSSEEHRARYAKMMEIKPPFTRMLELVCTGHGHGPAYGRNYAAVQAHGDYLCFLDDDDEWTDPEHLRRSATVIAASKEPVDLIFANQQAFRNGTPVPGVTWIEDLSGHVRGVADAAGAYPVTPSELLQCRAHCHLNTTIVSRALYSRLCGFDEGLRYEEDLDFYLRAIDLAQTIRFLPNTVARHNIPDPTGRASASTIHSELSKMLYRLRVLDKAVLFSIRPELQRHAMHQRSYVLKHLATQAARTGRFHCASYYAREALMTGFTLRWLAATVIIYCAAWIPFARSKLGNRAFG